MAVAIATWTNLPQKSKTGMLHTRNGLLHWLFATTSKVPCFKRNHRQGRVEISDLSLSLSLAEGNEKIGPLRFENKIRGAEQEASMATTASR